MRVVRVANSTCSILCLCQWPMSVPAWTSFIRSTGLRSNPDAHDSPTNHAHYDQTFVKQTTNCPSIGSTNSCIYPLFFLFFPPNDSSLFVMITRSRAKPPYHLCLTLIDCCSPVGATPFRRPRLAFSCRVEAAFAKGLYSLFQGPFSSRHLIMTTV